MKIENDEQLARSLEAKELLANEILDAVLKAGPDPTIWRPHVASLYGFYKSIDNDIMEYLAVRSNE